MEDTANIKTALLSGLGFALKELSSEYGLNAVDRKDILMHVQDVLVKYTEKPGSENMEVLRAIAIAAAGDVLEYHFDDSQVMLKKLTDKLRQQVPHGLG